MLLLLLSPEFSQQINMKKKIIQQATEIFPSLNEIVTPTVSCSYPDVSSRQRSREAVFAGHSTEWRSCMCFKSLQMDLGKTWFQSRPSRLESPFLSCISKSGKRNRVSELTTQFPVPKIHWNPPSRNEGGIQMILRDKKVSPASSGSYSMLREC